MIDESCSVWHRRIPPGRNGHVGFPGVELVWRHVAAVQKHNTEPLALRFSASSQRTLAARREVVAARR
jgi:hypothetical protein